DILIAGHIVKDLVSDGWRAGGGALYASAQARALGLSTAVVTACGPDIEPTAELHGVEWHVAPSASTTTFENTYRDSVRTQRLGERGRELTLDDIPAAWLDAPIVLLTPVFHDVAPELPGKLIGPGRLVGLGAQGWLRRLDGDRVLPGTFEPRPGWLHGNVVFVSEEDVSDAEAVAAWRQQVPVVVLTLGRRGCIVWDDGGRHETPALYSQEVDPTGAGDVFAAAFLVRYHEIHDAVAAARFAAAAAALKLRSFGLDGIGGRNQIEALLAEAAAVQAR
ncbi:MAG TPA: PfkB family carbohydrate kinase, partial [Dehalococcoidia bacterium]|nr:PfkB family carbohydrate kinase [Dehalococcoidia bacterium]